MSAPPQSPVGSDRQTVVGTQDYKSDDDMDGQGVRQESATMSDGQQDVSQPSASSFEGTMPRLQKMESRSLRSCCEKVAHEGAPKGDKGHAMRPFRSKQ